MLRDEGYEIGARYFDEEKKDSAKAILSLKFKQQVLETGSSGSPHNKEKLPKLPDFTISCIICGERAAVVDGDYSFCPDHSDPDNTSFNTYEIYTPKEPVLEANQTEVVHRFFRTGKPIQMQ